MAVLIAILNVLLTCMLIHGFLIKFLYHSRIATHPIHYFLWTWLKQFLVTCMNVKQCMYMLSMKYSNVFITHVLHGTSYLEQLHNTY